MCHSKKKIINSGQRCDKNYRSASDDCAGSEYNTIPNFVGHLNETPNAWAFCRTLPGVRLRVREKVRTSNFAFIALWVFANVLRLAKSAFVHGRRASAVVLVVFRFAGIRVEFLACFGRFVLAR